MLSCGWASTAGGPRHAVAADAEASQPYRSDAGYRIGDWYPQRDAGGKIGETKTLGVVGAPTASMSAAGQLRTLVAAARARRHRQFVGPIGANCEIATDAVLFTIEPRVGRESVEPRSATTI